MADTFFNRSVEEVLQEQESSSGGLSNAQAADRLKKYGPNALVEGKKKGVLQVFLEQFKDLLVVVLIVAAIISMLSGRERAHCHLCRSDSQCNPRHRAVLQGGKIPGKPQGDVLPNGEGFAWRRKGGGPLQRGGAGATSCFWKRATWWLQTGA